MEDTLRANKTVCEEWTKRRLNPCFNGRYSQSVIEAMVAFAKSKS